MSKYARHIVLAALVFAAVLTFARSTPATAKPSIDYYEECDQEGCSSHEVEELYESYEHECVVEGCGQEEVRELAGRTYRIDNMFQAFCNLGQNFTWIHSNVSRRNCSWTVGQRLTVRRHTNTSLSTRDVDRIMGAMTRTVGRDEGSGDVACRATFIRNGGVGTFSTGDGSIDTSSELSAVFGVGGNVKVVNQVNFCGGRFRINIIGCGQTPGTSFITERFDKDEEGILWAHEYGHNKGLPHRSSNTALMNPTIASNRLRVNSTECTALRN